MHAFCHAIPDRWHQMGVTLSAASSLRWWAEITGMSEAHLLDEVPRQITRPARPLFSLICRERGRRIVMTSFGQLSWGLSRRQTRGDDAVRA